MAVKTFTAGSVLTASDTNTYLANAGLVYITSGTLSSTSKDFAGCFTSTYTNYRIVLDSVQTSGNADIYARMLSSTTPATGADYNWAILGYNSNAAATNSNASANTLAYTGFTQIGAANTVIGAIVFDIYGPQLAQRTFATTQAVAYDTYFSTRAGMWEHNLTTAYDGIRFLTNSAVTMGGNVTIYGYRKA